MTGPDGAIIDRKIIGKTLEIETSAIGAPADSMGVFYYDLPLHPKAK